MPGNVTALQRPLENQSYVKGAAEPPLLDVTIPAMLAGTAAVHPDSEAVIFCGAGIRWTYRELTEQVDRLAAHLLDLDIYKGDRVGIWSPNRSEWILAQYATARIGAILVNINSSYRKAELEYALTKVGVKALLTAVSHKSSHYLAMLRELAPELEKSPPGRLRAARLPELRTVIAFGHAAASGIIAFDTLMQKRRPGQRARLDAISRSLSPSDPINIQFTSGTTGEPKGATLTHRNIVNNARFVASSMRLDANDRLCIPVPLYHCFGMVLGSLACTATGAAMVFPGEAFDAGETLQALAEEHCTAVHGVPTMFIAMVDHPEFRRFRLKSLRTGIMSGAPCPRELMKRVVADMYLKELTICYGMTETSPVSFQTDPGDPLERRISTVGRIQPHAEVKVINADGATVGIGDTGELCTRGYLVMQGYWGDRERTNEAIDADGWMHTGDLGTIDEQGYCKIVGRVKDMLIRGGENIYPLEIEAFLFRHPDIADIQVFGVPDDRYGEEICAWITPRPGVTLTEEAIRAYCRDNISHYKVPRHIRFVDEMPLTVTGKPQKFIMREKMIAELGLSN